MRDRAKSIPCPAPVIHRSRACRIVDMWKQIEVSLSKWHWHRPATLEMNWRFARGIPPHTFAEETVIDLVNAATRLDDVIAHVTSAFGRNLTSEERLRQEAAAARGCGGARIWPRSSRGRREARIRSWSIATTATSSKPTGSRPPVNRPSPPSPTAGEGAVTGTTRSTD